MSVVEVLHCLLVSQVDTADSESWPHWTGPFNRTECTALGGKWTSKSRQACIVSWTPATHPDATTAAIEAAKARRKAARAQLEESKVDAAAVAEKESKDDDGAAAGDEDFDTTDAVVVSGTAEWPELDATCTVVGYSRDGSSVCLYVNELTAGPPDLLSWLLTVRITGDVEETELSGSWDAIASAVPPPPNKVCERDRLLNLFH